MADDTTNQAPQSSIPPRAVPPQVRPVTGAGGTPAPIPHSVRLKPTSVVNTVAVPAPGLPPVSPSAPAGSEAAAAAIKRMTARIVMMANDVEPAKKNTGSIPAGATVSDGDATVKKPAARMPLATTVPIPDLSETPKTIKIQSSSGAQSITGTQQISVDDLGIGKKKAATSRIPLESAMSVPASGAATSTPAPTDGAPKTIKLKRPGEMSTIRVNIPSRGPAAPASAPATTGEQSAGESSDTQKKTIRVKRPLTSPVASVSGEGATAGAPLVSTTPLAVAPAAERGLAAVVALAAASVLVGIGLTLLLWNQTQSFQ